MYIPGFWVGVIFTILTEVAIIIFLTVLGCKSNTKSDNDFEEIDNTNN